MVTLTGLAARPLEKALLAALYKFSAALFRIVSGLRLPSHFLLVKLKCMELVLHLLKDFT